MELDDKLFLVVSVYSVHDVVWPIDKTLGKGKNADTSFLSSITSFAKYWSSDKTPNLSVNIAFNTFEQQTPVRYRCRSARYNKQYYFELSKQEKINYLNYTQKNDKIVTSSQFLSKEITFYLLHTNMFDTKVIGSVKVLLCDILIENQDQAKRLVIKNELSIPVGYLTVGFKFVEHLDDEPKNLDEADNDSENVNENLIGFHSINSLYLEALTINVHSFKISDLFFENIITSERTFKCSIQLSFDGKAARSLFTPFSKTLHWTKEVVLNSINYNNTSLGLLTVIFKPTKASAFSFTNLRFSLFDLIKSELEPMYIHVYCTKQDLARAKKILKGDFEIDTSMPLIYVGQLELSSSSTELLKLLKCTARTAEIQSVISLETTYIVISVYMLNILSRRLAKKKTYKLDLEAALCENSKRISFESCEYSSKTFLNKNLEVKFRNDLPITDNLEVFFSAGFKSTNKEKTLMTFFQSFKLNSLLQGEIALNEPKWYTMNRVCTSDTYSDECNCRALIKFSRLTEDEYYDFTETITENIPIVPVVLFFNMLQLIDVLQVSNLYPLNAYIVVSFMGTEIKSEMIKCSSHSDFDIRMTLNVELFKTMSLNDEAFIYIVDEENALICSTSLNIAHVLLLTKGSPFWIELKHDFSHVTTKMFLSIIQLKSSSSIIPNLLSLSKTFTYHGKLLLVNVAWLPSQTDENNNYLIEVTGKFSADNSSSPWFISPNNLLFMANQLQLIQPEHYIDQIINYNVNIHSALFLQNFMNFNFKSNNNNYYTRFSLNSQLNVKICAVLSDVIFNLSDCQNPVFDNKISHYENAAKNLFFVQNYIKNICGSYHKIKVNNFSQWENQNNEKLINSMPADVFQLMLNYNWVAPLENAEQYVNYAIDDSLPDKKTKLLNSNYDDDNLILLPILEQTKNNINKIVGYLYLVSALSIDPSSAEASFEKKYHNFITRSLTQPYVVVRMKIYSLLQYEDTLDVSNKNAANYWSLVLRFGKITYIDELKNFWMNTKSFNKQLLSSIPENADEGFDVYLQRSTIQNYPQFFVSFETIVNIYKNPILQINVLRHEKLLNNIKKIPINHPAMHSLLNIDLLSLWTNDDWRKNKSKSRDVVVSDVFCANDEKNVGMSSPQSYGKLTYNLNLLTPEESKIFDFKPISTIKSRVCELRVAVHSITISNSLKDKLKSIYVKMILINLDDGKEQAKESESSTNCVANKFVVNWRFLFPFDFTQKNYLLKTQVWATSAIFCNELVSEQEFQLRKEWSKIRFNAKHKLKFLYRKQLGYKLNNFKSYEYYAQIDLEADIVTLLWKKALPVGEGRSEPNRDPYLEKPAGKSTNLFETFQHFFSIDVFSSSGFLFVRNVIIVFFVLVFLVLVLKWLFI